MISDVDASLSALLRAEALPGTETEIVFDAPTTEWASRRSSGPVIDVFLYDIREDPARRDNAAQPQRDLTGRITGRKPGVRYFRLSYLLTAWTRRPEDEHRLLGQLLESMLQYERIPADYLRGRYTDDTIVLNMAQPAAPDRSLADIWNALGGEMKPSLDLVAIAPVRPGRTYPVGPPVQEPQVRMLRRAEEHGPAAAAAAAAAARRAGAVAVAPPAGRVASGAAGSGPAGSGSGGSGSAGSGSGGSGSGGSGSGSTRSGPARRSGGSRKAPGSGPAAEPGAADRS
jgi:hypothetical protein